MQLKNTKVFLLVLFIIANINGDATDCSTTGSGLSLYLRVCCVNNNLGQSVTVKGNGITRYILCPKVPPKSCPSGMYTNNRGSILDCKILHKAGYNTSGVYSISPDGGTAFNVSFNLTCASSCNT